MTNVHQVADTGLRDTATSAEAPVTASPRRHTTDWHLNKVIDGLREARHDWRQRHGRELELGSRELPSHAAIHKAMDTLCGILFPMRLGPPELNKEGEDHYVGYMLNSVLNVFHTQVALEVDYKKNGATSIDPLQAVRQFAERLPQIRRTLDLDVTAAYRGDPAATCVDEVLICYPGVYAVIYHRVAHEFYKLGLPLIARIISEKAHSATGIDIHPGATIGQEFFIDHGTGVVIGETAIIGNRVRLYQAVTLGAVRFPEDESGSLKKGEPRHPIVEDDVVIYAGATILGRITIGKGTVIGGNVWLTRSLPANSQISQASSRNSRDCVTDDCLEISTRGKK
ncbi:MAG: serine O-acetyltransferase EpsC [Marinobacter sp.]|uniref:serine O-acetyltransferase EpsC n=1 Tax=Marinobacter sp. TaxID=50741 RepID=UPI00299E2231|nr:serine O-acetyltransferase EpsC [Marinobacter sp.]MDX1634106.1 serine O-acetyltransferase EpsC [Marinobacter sp.]